MGNVRLKNEVLETYLKNQLLSGNFVHFMVFAGQAGSGKLETAKEFSRTLLCEKGSDEACGSCHSCKLTGKLNHPDLLILDGNDAIKISQVRELQKNIYLKPYMASHKVAVINSAERMTEESANAFLKVLEEPPASSIIILTTSEKTLLPETILSRGQIIHFGQGETDLDSINPETAADITLVLNSQKSLAEKFQIASQHSKDREGAMQFLNSFEGFLRQILLGKIGVGDYSEDFKNEMSEGQLIDYLRLASRSREFIKRNLSSKFVLENLIVNTADNCGRYAE